MADVIRAALDAHPTWWWPTDGISTEVGCTGLDCDWTASAVGVQPRDSHRAHQAEVATTAVLEVVGRVLDEHRLTVSYTDQVRHLQSLIAASLAGEKAPWPAPTTTSRED